MNRASRVGNVYGDITDLLQPIAAFIDPEKLRYRRGSLDAKLSGGYMRRKRGSGFSIFEKRAV